MFSINSFKAVTLLLLPFLKELFLRDMSPREALRSNKKKLYAIIIVIISVIVNMYMLPNYLSVSKQYLDLSKKYKQCVLDAETNQAIIKQRNIDTVKNLNKKEIPVEKTNTSEQPKEVAIEKNIKNTKTKQPKETNDKYSKIKDDYERMKRMEEGSN